MSYFSTRNAALYLGGLSTTVVALYLILCVGGAAHDDGDMADSGPSHALMIFDDVMRHPRSNGDIRKHHRYIDNVVHAPLRLREHSTGAGEAFNVGHFLECTSHHAWALIGVGMNIGLSVMGAGWCALLTFHDVCTT